MSSHSRMMGLAILGLLVVAGTPRAADAQDDAAVDAVRQSAQQFVSAFNAGRADAVVKMFLAKGELIDEEGFVYQGRQQIKKLLDAFFTKFPGAKLALTIESIRLVGPVAIEEGMRTMTTADDKEKARFRYIAVWARTDRGWQLASFRDFADDPAPTANEYLQPLAWMVGDWINEGADGKVAISYRWSKDNNFLLGKFDLASADGTVRESTIRIGWDPSAGKIRSWLFDSDGGFAEATWAADEEGIVVKSASVNPDGTTASATMYITPEDDDRFTIEGTDRIIGGMIEDDFEITVSRRPPAAGK